MSPALTQSDVGAVWIGLIFLGRVSVCQTRRGCSPRCHSPRSPHMGYRHCRSSWCCCSRTHAGTSGFGGHAASVQPAGPRLGGWPLQPKPNRHQHQNVSALQVISNVSGHYNGPWWILQCWPWIRCNFFMAPGEMAMFALVTLALASGLYPIL